MDEVGITVKDFSQGNSALCMQKLTCTSYAGACSRNVFFAAKGFLEKEFFFALWIWEWMLSCIFTVPLAWPHTCDIRKLVIFIAGRGSSRREGPDSLSRAQGKPVLGLLIKPAETKNILKNRPFFFFPYKMSVDFFFFSSSCVSYGFKQGCESHSCSGSLHLDLGSALGQFLSCQLWPLPSH